MFKRLARQIVASIASVIRGIGAKGKHGLTLIHCPLCKKAFKEKLEMAIHIARFH
jgi:hypothetical protein